MASKYGKKAAEKVKKVMRERKAGTLKSGRSGKKVTSRKQAIAIGLSEARRAGGKVPPPKKAPPGVEPGISLTRGFFVGQPKEQRFRSP